MSEQRITSFDNELLKCIKNGSNVKALSMLNKKLARTYDDFGTTLLHHAVTWKNYVIALKLIELGADVDALRKDGQTPLMIALKCCSVTFIKRLLRAGASVYVVNADDKSILQMALELGKNDSAIVEVFARKVRGKTRHIEEQVERLISAGCNMFHAVKVGGIDLLKCMLERGVDVDSRGSSGWTALHLAADLDDYNLATWLVDNGADVNSFDELGISALMLSSTKGNSNMMSMLLERGADPNCKVKVSGITPFFLVIANYMDRTDGKRYIECAKLLLEYGAIPQNLIIRDITMFDYACVWSISTMTKMLIGHLAMLEMLGKCVTKSIMYCHEERNKPKQLIFENIHEQCQQILAIDVFEKLSLLDLLNENERKMEILVRNENFGSAVEKICAEHKLKEVNSYYYDMLMKRIDKARRVVDLENEAISVICKLFDGSYNQCYDFGRKVVGYLDERDLVNLLQVYGSREF